MKESRLALPRFASDFDGIARLDQVDVDVIFVVIGRQAKCFARLTAIDILVEC